MAQSGSLKALFPRPRGEGLEAVLVNTAGGITGGDRFRVDATAGTGTRLTLTSQAAERAYRAVPGAAGRMETRLQVDPGARLDWLPQETILYDGCNYDRRLDVDMAPDARLLLVEPLVFGRAAMGEVLSDARFTDRIEVRRADVPLYLDRIVLDGDIAARLARPFTANGAGAMATLLFAAPEAEAQLAPLRALLPETGGASLLGPDLLVARILATDSFELRRSLVPALTRLTGHDLPRPWMM